MKLNSLRLHKLAGLGVLALIAAMGPGRADTFNFNGADLTSDYSDGFNWDVGTVPNTGNGDIAVIGAGFDVTYNAGPDLNISNGGVLRIDAGGSWTQINGPAYIQLGQTGGLGTVLVNGGTFNQGTSTSTAFNLGGSGTGAFIINSGAANFNTSFNLNTGFAYTQNGGTVTISTAGELDFNNTTGLITGGVLNAKLMTGINDGGANHIFTIAGGAINLSDANPIYGGGTADRYVNFSLNSTGVMNFSGIDLATAQGLINSGAVRYNGAIDTTDLQAIQNGAFVTIYNIDVAAVPEPSTWALLGGGLMFLGLVVRRRITV